ncbi:MAG: hypothetical protein AAGE98_11040 [Actinomycetota bacterium]
MNPPEGELLDIDLDWDRTSTTPLGDADVVEPSSPRRGFDPRWLIGVAVVGYLVWLFGLGGGGSSSSGSGSGPGQPADGVPAAVAQANPDVGSSAGSAGTGATFDPDLDVAADIAALTDLERSSSYLEVMVDADGNDLYTHIRPLDAVRGDPRFAFIGADGNPVVVDSVAGDVVSIAAETELADFDGDPTGLALLRDADDGVIGFDPGAFGTAVRVSTGAAVVRRHTGDFVIVARTDDAIEYGTFVPGEVSERTVLPSSARIDIVDGVGVYIEPSSGGTFEVTPDGLEQVTAFDMITTNGTRWLERRRLVEGTEDWVVDADGTEWQISREAFEVRGDVVISPDGRWLYLSRGTTIDDIPILYGIETGEIVTLDSREDGLPGVWSPNSDFLASLDLDRECLWMDFTNGLTGCVSLNRLSIPPAPDSHLVIY